jgi:outer membrane receptor protein involved in Fe transport
MQTRQQLAVELWMAPTRISFFWGVVRHESKRVARAGLTIACLLLLGWMTSGGNAWGQAVYGSIAGTVYDSTGAGVPRAAVTITDLQKNINYATTTNDSGNYNQSHLIIGRYRVKVELAGFKTAVQDSVELAVDTVTTVDVTLQPGDVTQTIEVKEEVPLLKTERTDVSTTLSQRSVGELPTFGRNFTQLMLLTPGAIQYGWNDTSTENPQGGIAVNVNGQFFVGVGALLDGTDNRDMMYGNMIIVPDLDSVVQAKVTSSNYDAEFGSASAAVVTTSTKSGTNEFHGTAFLYRRNDVTQARDPFAQTTADPVTGLLLPKTLWDQFGGSIGGPIKKNKVFFFADYQGTRAKDGGSNIARVPTAAERTGDLSALAAATGQNIYNPFDASGNVIAPSQRQPFPGNIIPLSLLSQPALNLLKYVPLPDMATTDPSAPNFSGGGQDTYNADSINARVDYFKSDRLRFFERYTYTQFLKEAPGLFGGLAGGPQLNNIGYTGKGDTRPQSMSAGFDYTVTPRVLTDFRFGWYRQRIFVDPLVKGSFASDAGAPGLNIASDPTTLNMPAFFINDPQSGFQFGSSLYNNCNCPLIEKMQQFQFVNNWSLIKGNHTFKLGVDIHRLQNLRVPSDQHRAGQLNFNPDFTRYDPPPGSNAASSAGSGLATYLLGDVSSFSRYVSNSLDAGERQTREFFYAQDTWRVTPKLTLNYGLRWEIYNPQTVTGKDKGGWLDITKGEMLVAGENHVPLNGNVKNNFTNLAPRLGIAYQVTDKTVIRVGYGRTFDVGTFGSIFGHSVTQNLPVLGTQNLNPSNSWQSVFNLAQGPPLLNPSTVLDNQPKGPDGNPIYPNGLRAWVYPNKMRLPTVDAWNATVQRQLTPTISIEAGYVGNKGTHVIWDDGPYYDLNAPVLAGFAQGLSTDQRRPFFNKFGWNIPLQYFGNDASNHYNSLQTKVEKRFGHGYSFLAHYTYAHAKSSTTNLYHESPQATAIWYGRPDYLRDHVVVGTNIWELPFGKGKRFLGNVSKAADMLVGGWEITDNTTWMSGGGFNTGYAECGSDNDIGNCHPDRIGSTSVSNQNASHWYAIAPTPLTNNGDTSGPWRRPQVGVLGTDVRNSLIGPKWFQTDASLIKNIQIREQVRAQFRAEFFNLFNHVNLGNPNGCVDCSTAGEIFGLANNAIMRRLQFAIRVEF